jgi:hypothetical protein
MEVTVGFRRKPSRYTTVMFLIDEIGGNDRTDEIERLG